MFHIYLYDEYLNYSQLLLNIVDVYINNNEELVDRY